MENPFREKIRELEDERDKLEIKLENLLQKENMKDILESVKDFCDECPIKLNSPECLNCYLHPWIDKAKETSCTS